MRRKVRDNLILDLVESALKADIIFNNKIIEHVSGTLTGGILSPLLSNIYLHELDQFMEEIMKEYQGTSSLSYPGSLHPPLLLRRGLLLSPPLGGIRELNRDLGSYPPFSF